MSRYPEAEAHGGKLVHRQGIPILITTGTADRIGQQVGTLAMPYAKQLYGYPYDYLRDKIRLPLVRQLFWLLLKRKCRQLAEQLPPNDHAEIQAIAQACSDRGQLIPGNTLFDMTNIGIRPLFGCSSFIVPPERSATGNLLLGRNLDFEPLGYLHEYSLIQIYPRQVNCQSFASVAFPGFVGCFSGMNESGLSLVRHEVIGPNCPRAYHSHGMPFGAALRRVMETCRTVQEATDYLANVRHATVNIVIVADAQSSAVLEVTPDGVWTRPTQAGLVGCSNHFLHPTLRNPQQPNEFVTLNRHDKLEDFARQSPEKLGVGDVWTALHQVHQDELTLQTMCFEPAAKTIHVTFGAGPTTARAPVALPMNEFWT